MIWFFLVIIIQYSYKKPFREEKYRVHVYVTYRTRGRATATTIPVHVYDSSQSDEIARIDPPWHSKHYTVNVPPYSKAVIVEQILNLCRPSLIMVTSPYKWNVYEWNIKEHLVCVLTDFLVCWALSTRSFFLFENNTEWFYVANYLKWSFQVIIRISGERSSNILFSYSTYRLICDNNNFDAIIKSYRP